MRDRPFDPNREPRSICIRCFRPDTHCLCDELTPFVAHCNFLLLQHPHERKKYHSTAKILLRALKNAQVMRGITFDRVRFEQILAGKQAYLLYPSEDAIDAAHAPLSQDSTVVVIDGTWIEARKIIYRNPYLKQLPAFSFRTPLRSNFIIRKQPREGCLSTIESVAHLLQLNAKALRRNDLVMRYEGLLAVFSKMVATQFSYFPRMRKNESVSLASADRTNIAQAD